jgi:hypothetical protein
LEQEVTAERIIECTGVRRYSSGMNGATQQEPDRNTNAGKQKIAAYFKYLSNQSTN